MNKLTFLFLIFAFVFLGIFPAVYGLILAFKASIILGLLALIIEPSPTVIGWIAIIGHPELCQKIATLLGL